MTSAAPLAGAAQDAAPTPEAGIVQTAAASQPITTTGILTGVVLPAVDLPLSATGVVTWNVSAPDAAVSLPAPLLTMSADPFQIVPGGVITYSVAITNVAGAPLARVALDSRLPTGVVYVAQSGVGFSYSPRDQRLSWAIERIEPGRGLRGSFQLRATGLGIGQLITNTVSAASADAPVVTASAVVEVAPPRQNRVWATPGEGGWLRSEDGRVDLRAPAGAVGSRTEIRYSPAGLELPEHIFYAFDLTARDEAGQAVTQFQQPLALSAVFNPRQLPPDGLDRLALFHLNEQSGEWEAMPSQIDPRWRRVTASVEHFSAYGLGLDAAETVPGFSVDRMTTVRGAQTSLYSGSITFSYGFDLPPGRGGLTPVLGLSYNSANHSQQQGHYSYVGHGWGMPGADYVQRDPTSGKTTLLLGGQAYTLECYSNCSIWFVKESPLIKVAYQQSGLPFYGGSVEAIWTITTPDGLAYEYRGQINLVGSTLQYPYPMTFYWSGYTNGSWGEWRDPIWERIPLTQVRDRHGNQVNYTWNYELNYNDQMPYGHWPSTSIISTPQHIRAVRLTGITYNSGRNQVAVGYGSRLDRPDGYDWPNTWHFYTEQRATSVAVQTVWNGQSSPTTLRTYVLNHRDQGDPNASRSTKLLSLIYVEEQAGSRSVRTSFDYSGHDAAWPCTYRYLTKVQNAFGGVVEFAAVGGGSANNNADCSSGNPIYWQPPTVTKRIERDTITGSEAIWKYGAAQWNDDAHGFARVWVTAPESQSCQIHEFLQMTQINGQERNHLAGRSNKSTTCTACTEGGACVANGELGRSETDWTHSSADLPLPNYSALPEQDRPRFVWAAENRIYESRFNNDGTLAAVGVPIKRTTYEYQTARQVGNVSGARQFGNLTGSQEYQGTWTGFEAAPLRANVMQYRPNESTWVIAKPASTQLYSGNETILIAETRLYYDNNSSHTAAPSKGLLTKQETMAVLNGAYQSNPASKVRTFQYYANGNLQWQRDEQGQQATFYYDAWYQAHLVCQVNPLGHQAKTTYYGVPGDGTCNTANGSTSSIFNRFGQPEKQWDANNALSEYRYDDLGWMTAMAAAPDVIGAPTARREFRSLSSIGANQPFWLHQQQRDTSGGDNTLHTWTYYDGFGRVLQTKAEADANGSTARHVETSFDYTWRDGVWREGVPRFVNGSVAVAGTAAPTYSPPSWNAASQDETIYTYDRLGRLSVKTLPNGAQVRQFYNVIPDAQNRSHAGVAVIDEANRQTIHQTDPFGRLVVAKQYTNSYASGPSWTDAAYAQVRYDYNVADQLVTVAGVDPDAAGPMPRPTTTITYDSFGQKASLIDPDMGMWLYRWDLAGNLRKQRDARNVLTCFYYDNLNRLVGKSFHPNTPDPASVNCSTQPTPYPVTYSYDTGPNGKGRRTGMADPSGSTAWEYDVRGRMTKETKVVSGTGGGTFVTQWNSYDAMDRVRSMTYPDGEGVTFSYAAQGPIKTVYGSNTYYVGETLYSALGQVTDRYLGSTAGLIRQKYTYTQAENFRLTSLRSGTSASGYTNLQNLSYSYDAVGNVVSIVDAALTGGSQTQTFTYDALHRLTRGYSSGNMSGWYDEDYTYDPAGNLTTKGKPKSIWWAYSYGQQAADCPQGALSKPHAVVSAVAMPYFNHYCYDQNGNMVRRRLGTADVLPRTADAPVSSIGQAIPETQVIDTYLLAYDEENWLKEVSLNGAVVATYTYDGDGKRVKAVVEGVATVYIGNHYERDNGTTVKKYYYAGEVRIAMRTGGNTHYLLNDHLNSTAITTNSNGALVASLLYKPWGETRYDFGVTPTTWRFTGQREDATIGLYYFNARHYDAALARFIQPDTIVPQPGNPQALNRYSYVGNRPTMLVDPSGHCSTPSVNGSIGCTGVTGGLTVPLIIDPATQPLTVSADAGSQDTQQAVMRAHHTAADDGVLLMYQIPGYAQGRAEVIIVSAGVPDNPLVNGGVEVRRVWSGREAYEETAISGGIGFVGAEWSSHKGETQPSIGTSIAGVGVQLQPGQLMAGAVNPLGPGGMRVGAEWRVESASTFITTQGYLNSVGGTNGFGIRYAGDDARLIRQAQVRGDGKMSGIQRLRLILWAHNFPYEERP